jgi:hypothetical protein
MGDTPAAARRAVDTLAAVDTLVVDTLAADTLAAGHPVDILAADILAGDILAGDILAAEEDIDRQEPGRPRRPDRRD